MDLSLYVQVLGTLLFCFVFLFLWRRSGIVYFGLWSAAWAVQSVSLLLGFRNNIRPSPAWLAPYAVLEFAFALLLFAAARAGLSGRVRDWKTPLKLLVLFPLFLLLVYLVAARGRAEAYHGLHGVLLCSVYYYNFATIGGSTRPAAKAFRFSLLLLSLAFLQQAATFAYIYLSGTTPTWARFLQYDRFYDFALHAVLAFAALAMWIETQNDRIAELGNELDRVRRDSARNLDLDHLTGLLNQSALAKRMESLEAFEGVVAVCDMDNFKEINDQYGHLVGDEILRSIGHLLRSSVRPQDEAFRWGGDEFVILFLNQDGDVVRKRMREIEARLQDFRVRGYRALAISFSWGTAEASGGPLRETLDLADRDMYANKRERRAR